MQNNNIYQLGQLLSKVNICGPLLFLLLSTISCRKILELDPPKSKIERDVVFSNDVTATGALLGIYRELAMDGFACGAYNAFAALAGLSADELSNFYKYDPPSVEFEENNLNSTNSYVASFWASAYSNIYRANSVIEGVSLSIGITDDTKKQLTGEALFLRAFCNFYLVNIFGDVPLVLTTNYQENSKLSKTKTTDVYTQIINDLDSAEGLLSSNYIAESQERIRVNKFAVAAFRARVYLYTGNWMKAEEMASEVINQNQFYNLETNLNRTFLKNSAETIWQLMPLVNANGLGTTNEGGYFSPDVVLYYNVLRSSLVKSFELNDLRSEDWIDTLFLGADTVYYPTKYKQSRSDLPISEYSMVLRLSEQFLIRAEARVMQGKLVGENSAAEDINIIRERAGLDGVLSNSESDLLNDILRERKHELFTEWGHRWLDLKRLNKSIDVLGALKPGLSVSDLNYPIPQSEITKNPNLQD